jgi:hypothetical protein
MRNPSLLSRPAAANFLGVRVETIDSAVALGQLPIVKLGFRTYIPVEALEDLLTAKYETAPGQAA